MSRFLVLQHLACEHPGRLGPLLAARGIGWDTVELDEGDAIPDPTAYDGLLVFGGPMNVDEEAEHPWLAAEKQAIREAVAAGVPLLGVCLGAQLLARALGAEVRPAPAPEVGVLDVRLTPAAAGDPLFRGLPDPLPCVQWHGDTFDLPPGATLLASSQVCENQAFRVGDAWGIQFHVEVTPAMADEWGAIPAYCASIEEACGPDGLERLRAGLVRHAAGFERTCERLLDGFAAVAAGRS